MIHMADVLCDEGYGARALSYARCILEYLYSDFEYKVRIIST